jgi:sugar O-acyltransferase (sialic acid O-acetyltransferase NeuD family)
MTSESHNITEGKPVILLGAGGHAKVLINTLLLLKREILGYVVAEKMDKVEMLGIQHLGDDEDVLQYNPQSVELVNGLGVLPGKTVRWKLDNDFSVEGYSFMTVVHPSAVVALDVKLSEGVQVMAGSVIQPGVEIGRATIINTKVSIDHDCDIGEYCHIAPGVTMSGDVTVGKNVHIGTGSSVTQGITISDHAIVGAGSLVYKDVNRGVQLLQERNDRITVR